MYPGSDMYNGKVKAKVPGGERLKIRKTADSGAIKKALQGRPGGRGSGLARKLAGPVVVVLAVVGVLALANYLLNSGEVYGGVEAGSVDLGGMSLEEARTAVEEQSTGALQSIQLTNSGTEPESFSIPAEEIGVRFDAGATADKAYAVGREGNVVERVEDRFTAATGTVQVDPEVAYNPDVARERLENLAGRLDQQTRNASVEVVGQNAQVYPSQTGYEMDVPATLANVEAAVEDLSGEAEISYRSPEPVISTTEAETAAARAEEAMSSQLVFMAEGQRWTLNPVQIGRVLNVNTTDGDVQVSVNGQRLRQSLSGMYGALSVEPAEAGFVVNGNRVNVTESRTGRQIQTEKLVSAVESGVFEGQRSFEVPVNTIEPELTTAEAQQQKPTTAIGSYRTNYLSYDDSPGRVTNLKTAASAVDGTVLAPGEVFSFNELAAPLQYADTKVILNGRVSTAEGGGLCQVSSTLYMAAQRANLDIVERYPHYAELPYIRPGFDATVWFGREGGQVLDMKFENSSSGYLLLQEWVDEEGYVNATIYGQPNNADVSLSSRKVNTSTDDEGNPVTKWVTSKKVAKNGEVIFNGPIHTDTYKYLKPEEEGAPADAPVGERPST